jgi:DNA polymerase III sliding clamp (beta) subunit (PCNA family)
MITLTRDELANLISLTKFAASKKDGKPGLRTVRIEPSETGLVAVATDSYRLAVLKIDQAEPISTSFTLEADALITLDKAIPKKTSQPIVISISDGNVSADWDGSTYRVATSDAPYPNWKTLIPSSYPETVENGISLNGHFLASIKDFTPLLGDSSSRVIIEQQDTKRPICISNPKRTAYVLLMPVRV